GISVRVLFTLLLLVFLLSLAVGCFFFFQAEDGIRALYVTGVQTCALPISIPEELDPGRGAKHESERDRHNVEKHDLLEKERVRDRERHVGDRRRAEPRSEEKAAAQAEIGRASCRESVENAVEAGSRNKKKR